LDGLSVFNASSSPLRNASSLFLPSSIVSSICRSLCGSTEFMNFLDRNCVISGSDRFSTVTVSRMSFRTSLTDIFIK